MFIFVLYIFPPSFHQGKGKEKEEREKESSAILGNPIASNACSRSLHLIYFVQYSLIIKLYKVYWNGVSMYKCKRKIRERKGRGETREGMKREDRAKEKASTELFVSRGY
jgi:hypothetical protein